jgi:V/A-type H+-transporting ATPase subunit A
MRMGDRLRARDRLGTVQEDRYTHKIMIPFDEPGEVAVTWMQQGNFTVELYGRTLRSIRLSPAFGCRPAGSDRYPCNRKSRYAPLPQQLPERRYSERLYPESTSITK